MRCNIGSTIYKEVESIPRSCLRNAQDHRCCQEKMAESFFDPSHVEFNMGKKTNANMFSFALTRRKKRAFNSQADCHIWGFHTILQRKKLGQNFYKS